MEIKTTSKQKRHYYVKHSSGVIFAFTKQSMRKAFLESTPSGSNRVLQGSRMSYGARVTATEVDTEEKLVEVIRDCTPRDMQ